MDQQDDLLRWTRRYEADPHQDRSPSAWIMNACLRLPGETTFIDVAAGAGRHALALAREGRRVVAVDFVERAIGLAARSHPRVSGVVANVWAMPFRHASLDAIICTNFLERSLFTELKRLVKTGGFIVYETYTAEHLRLAEEKRLRAPRSSAYLLEPGELNRLASPFAILDSREGFVHDDAGERYCASVLAQKTG